VSTFRPPTNSAKRSLRFGPLPRVVCAVSLAGALALTGCSSKKTADTTVAAASDSQAPAASETTTAVEATTAETAAATTDVASVETSAAGIATTLAGEPATADSVASDSAPAGATPTSVDPQAAMEAAIVTGMSSQLGVTDPKQLACVGESVKGVDFAKPEGQGKILRGVLKCAPDAMAVQGATSLREANPAVTEAQSICVVKATFEVLSAMPDADLVSAMSSSKLSPAIVEATLAKAKGCGLSEAEIRKAIQQ
jgi:hypothetical protein